MSTGCRMLTVRIAEAIEALVTEKAENGLISVDKVQRIIRSLAGEQSAFVGALHLHEERCKAALRTIDEAAAKRTDAFRRLVTRPVEHLLIGEPPPYPRRFLPNYFQVVDQALDDKLEHFRTQTQAVYQGLRLKHGGSGVWDAFFSDPRTERLMVHVVRRVTRFVDSPAGQWTWPLVMSRAQPDGSMPTTEQTDRLWSALRIAWQGMCAEEAIRDAANGRQ